jgi:hypothetical protein
MKSFREFINEMREVGEGKGAKIPKAKLKKYWADIEKIVEDKGYNSDDYIKEYFDDLGYHCSVTFEQGSWNSTLKVLVAANAVDMSYYKYSGKTFYM